jgi:ubiquinone biosynthesis protein
MLAAQIGLDAILASSVPKAYARYGEPLAGALGFFVNHLSPQRASASIADQLALPADASDGDRLVALARRSPVLHKLGQILARDRRLEPGLRRTLQQLESMPSSMPVAVLQAQIESELGDLNRAGIVLDRVVLAEASVAVVIGFTWRGEHGVFKLLKPGVERDLDDELAILDPLGTFLAERCDSLGLPPLDYRETLAQVRQLLAHEVRLDCERGNLIEAGRALEGVPGVRVPRLLPFQTRRLLAMERIDGRKVTDVGSTSLSVRRKIARSIVEALIATPIWSADPDGLFHSDPHAGNLMIDRGGCLVPLDWCMAARLDVATREAVARVLIGAITRDTSSILAAIESMATRAVNQAALRTVVERNLGALTPLEPPGPSWSMRMLDEAVTLAGLRIGAPLLAFRKAMLTLDGVLNDIAPDVSLDRALLAAFLPRLIAEWPWRALLSPTSRLLPTRISNADLAQVVLALPWLPLLGALDWAASASRRLRGPVGAVAGYRARGRKLLAGEYSPSIL